ncbi:UdgX family uracil-DNA binding protein [Janthinobacterium sp. 1_2014MBL_MicDiv]|uniref:UdgX family uracil-DNA binding protein n=1 Tax=Janthinobacterium sp. 1_2014MBL_MicDiv TaxID=1644131 RepID=UPI0008F4ECDD|nr:UdgX family uracil-DNA binding protein [Janthinobacterium sp. 1_2014MBL_MicDiv]APA70833.1 DNA polymerase [Janthinobacterium sp. 1_2014MBL_MicDiv]
MNAVARLAQSFDEWRAAARELIARKVPPADVAWHAQAGDGDLFSSAPAPADAVMSAPALRLPRQLVELLEAAACFNAADRWAFLYQVLWRWQLGQHDVLSPADADGARLHAMAKAVRREEHDMQAYVRFRERDEAAGAPRFVAWFEPAHEVLPQVARHFARRMGAISWLIATPRASMLWDGATLHAGPALLRGAADIDDAGEALWLTYYRSIFNPARVNAGLLHSHIPSRFWKNLPEGAIVPAMLSGAANGERRTGQTASVGQRSGATMIPISAERAQPARDLPTTLDQCRRCELWKTATQAVHGTGPEQARIMLIGEQPGDQEDLAGLPFVGPAGALLQQAMHEAGMARDSVYLTNAVKHFKWEPRGKRRLHKTPAQREILACHGWLEQELASVKPQVIVALGSTALKALLQDGAASMTPLIGTPVLHDGRWVITVYHPAYVLRAPDAASRRQAYAVIVAGLRQALLLGQDSHHSVEAGTSCPSSRRA